MDAARPTISSRIGLADPDTDPDKVDRFMAEERYMKRRWGHILQGDPYYNPNLTFWFGISTACR
jgi:hypothetical protein